MTRKLFAIMLAALLAGCAGAKVSNQTQSAVALTPPDVVYVGAFDLGAAAVKSDSGTLTGRPRLLPIGQPDPAEKIQELSDLLSSELVSDLNGGGLAAQLLPPDAGRPAKGWLVSGQFLQLDEGNRLQKAIIGFGAGNSDARLYVTVADLSLPPDQDLLNFNIDSSGNKAPGGAAGEVVGHSPWGMAGKFVLDRNASEKDIKRAAKGISDQILTLAGKK
jgi:hypothetical protein